MRGFIVICLCATVSTVPQGYNYNHQQNDFSAHANTKEGSGKVQENHGFLHQPGNVQQAFVSSHNTQDFSTAPKFPQYHQPLPQNYDFGVQQVPLLNHFGGQQHQQQFSGLQQKQQYHTSNEITKDIYVHIAPEDVEFQQHQQQPALPPPPPRKHYRIVFIKAPSHNVHKSALRVQQAPIEEKTIIYVLTKKPDPLDLQAAFQDVQAKPPSKPEVYFIKYKTQEEAQHAQRTIQAQYDKLGGTSQISDEGIAPITSVIGSLDGAQKTRFDFPTGSGHSSLSSTSSVSSSNLNTGTTSNNRNGYLPPILKS